jgi:hypothetical protein
MITTESLFAMIDEMHAIHKQASIVAHNPFLNKQVKLQKVAPVHKASVSKDAKKRMAIPKVK